MIDTWTTSFYVNSIDGDVANMIHYYSVGDAIGQYFSVKKDSLPAYAEKQGVSVSVPFDGKFESLRSIFIGWGGNDYVSLEDMGVIVDGPAYSEEIANMTFGELMDSMFDIARGDVGA